MSAATILLVDDDDVLSKVLRRVLSREGYTVVEAGSVAQALEAARDLKPQLGLLDLSLPDGDGVELARKLRAQGVNCPFILITAYPLQLRDQPELGGAFSRILSKPLNLQELRQTIEAVLASPATAAARRAAAPSAAAPSAAAPESQPPAPALVHSARAATPGGRLRGAILGGVVLAGLAFFCFVVLLPALGLPGVGDWFGRSAPPTAPAPEAPPATLVKDAPNTLRLAPEVAERLGVRTEAVDRPKTMETLILSGTLNFDPQYLTRVHPLFPGEVVDVGPYEPEAPAYRGGEPRPLRFGDRVRENQLLAVLWSKDLGEKKNDLVEGLAKLWTDQESLANLEELYKDLATSQANVRLQRAMVANDLSAVDRARNALRIWRLTDEEITSVEGEARKIYEERVKALKAGDKTPPPSGDWKHWARLEVRARMPGTIVELNVPKTGELVDTSQDLFKVADLTHLVVWAHAYEQDLPLLRSLLPPIPWTVKITADPADPNSRDRILDSPSAYEVGPIIDPNQHTALVIGKADNADRSLRVGQFATASIPVPPPPNMVEVPADAIDEDGSPDGSIVFVQPDPNTPQYTLKRVKVTRRLQGRAFVLSEPRPGEGDGAKFDYLHVGDRVVTAGVVVLKSTLEDLQDREKAEK
jgi:cobalt-zinc-cadmium efflux system membrane fusion protein